MRRKHAPKFGLMIIVFLAIFSLGFYLLWNALIPDLFGGPELNYWQALGLLALSKLIFGFHGGGHRGKHCRSRAHRHSLKEKLANMSDEEREKAMSCFGHYRDLDKGKEEETPSDET